MVKIKMSENGLNDYSIEKSATYRKGWEDCYSQLMETGIKEIAATAIRPIQIKIAESDQLKILVEELKNKNGELEGIKSDLILVRNVRAKQVEELKDQIKILDKALHLYVNWADECGIAWDNFPDMEEKWYKQVEEKGLGWIEGLVYMAIEEAKDQLDINK